MKVRLGRELDGQRADAHRQQLDAITTGPLGMLNLLETQLGLLHPEAPTTERILQYRERLKAIDSPERFYHQSFQVDDLGTAATLLAWRDQWHLHGWGLNGTGLKTAVSRRLRDMSDLEALTQFALEPNIGERLYKVHLAMRVRKPRISSVTLFDELPTWPKTWRDVLQSLPLVTESAAPLWDADASETASILQQIQRAFKVLEQGQQPQKLKWQDDGTLCIVQSDTRALAGSWLAGELAGLTNEQAGNTLLLAPDASMLDDVLVAAAQARQGFNPSSAARPALQVLPLALGQLWKPMNLIGLLEFLTHPICPIPSIARTRLANMLTRSPGMGQGKAWDNTLTEIEQACAKADYEWEPIRARIRFWLEHDRFDPVQGAPLQKVIERIQALADYFHGRTKEADPAKRLAFISGQSPVFIFIKLTILIKILKSKSVGS